MNNQIIISAIQNHVKVFNGKQVKDFYENDLGFTDVFTEEDNYMDYFKSDEYLGRHINGNEEEIRKKLVNLHIELSDNQEDEEIKIIAAKLKSINIHPLPIKTEFEDRIKIMLEEAILMTEHKSYLGTIIFVGSILEGIILGMLKNGAATSQLQNDFRDSSNHPPTNRSGIVKDFEDWKLSQLLDMANLVGMYDDKKTNKAKADIIRLARNYVHPNEQITKSYFTSNDTFISVGCLEDIIDSFKKYGRYV
ncbi:MAG: hypothetical protein J6Z01_16545 [Bacteroidales bacterium]|nr:hypothetical protein [Bacteroidales bacterium]